MVKKCQGLPVTVVWQVTVVGVISERYAAARVQAFVEDARCLLPTSSLYKVDRKLL